MGSVFSRSGLIILSLVLVAFLALGCNGTEGNLNSELPDIGISWCDDIDTDEYGEDLQAYVDAVKKAGANPVLLPLFNSEEEVSAMIDTFDALILTGGEDIDPSYYNEEPDAYLEDVNLERDKSDYLLLEKALEKDMPILAICRGCQYLNVISGGTLYQDIPTLYDTDILHRSEDEIDFEYHDIAISEGSHLANIMGAGTLNVNSWHHQGIKELGSGLVVTAISEDGMIEAIERTDAKFTVGLQFHPEWHVDDGDEDFLKIFKELTLLAKDSQ